MTTDDLIRGVAVCVAAALVLAPYWEQIRDGALCVAGFAKTHATTAGRVFAAVLLIAAAWGKVPLPRLGAGHAVQTVSVDRPSEKLAELVSPISVAMAAAPAEDRVLWARLWTMAASVVAGDVPGEEQVAPDTKSLRLLNVLTLDIGWKRIGQHRPGQYVGLRAAVERAIADSLGLEQKPIDAAMRAKVVEVYRAIAWAGMNRE